jgi:zinc protease
MAMDILEDILHSPSFDSKRMKTIKSRFIQDIKHRFDNPAPIMNYAWLKLYYPNTVLSDLLTEDEVKDINKTSLEEYHNLIINKSPLIISFSGSMEKLVVEKSLDKLFPNKRDVVNPVVQVKEVKNPSQVLIIQKPINQAYIKMGNAIFKRPDKRYYPLTIFNDILGGGGFDSRLVSKVRSDAGLTYSISSRANSSLLYPGFWSVSLFTKSESVNNAVKLTKDVVINTIKTPLNPAEVESKKREFLSTLPSLFRNESSIVETYSNNEMSGWPLDHYINYPKKLNKVTLDEINSAVKSSITPDKFSIIIVGDTASLFEAPDWEDFNIRGLNPTVISVEELENSDEIVFE